MCHGSLIFNVINRFVPFTIEKIPMFQREREGKKYKKIKRKQLT